MFKLACALLLGLIVSLGVPTKAKAADAKGKATGTPSAVFSAAELAATPKPEGKPAEVKVPKDKPTRSKKNDDKDGDPDDGNAGSGNDDKTLPKDGPAND